MNEGDALHLLGRDFPGFVFSYDAAADLVWAKERLSHRKLRIGLRNEIQMRKYLEKAVPHDH